MNWDKVLTEIIEEISESEDVEVLKIKKIIEHVFKKVKECSIGQGYPKILLRGLGTFSVKPERIYKELEVLEKSKSYLTEEEYLRRRKNLEGSYERRVIECKKSKE